MSKWFQWVVLTAITRSPLLSILLLLVFWWVVDRFTLRILPNPVRLFVRWQRGERLQRMLLANPHDRRARFELADIRLEQRRYRAAMDILRPNLEAGDEDAPTLYLMGVALFGAGYPEQAEKLMAAVLEQDPGFRLGAAHLEQGRWRLARGDFQGARTSGGPHARGGLARVCERPLLPAPGGALLGLACAALAPADLRGDGPDGGPALQPLPGAWRRGLGCGGRLRCLHSPAGGGSPDGPRPGAAALRRRGTGGGAGAHRHVAEGP